MVVVCRVYPKYTTTFLKSPTFAGSDGSGGGVPPVKVGAPPMSCKVTPSFGVVPITTHTLPFQYCMSPNVVPNA